MNKRYLYFSIVIGLLAACKQKAKENTAPPPTPVAVTEVKEADAVYYDPYEATVVALNSVELRSQVAGFITGIFFKEGDVVPKGKPLYEIDRRKYQAAYEQAKANLSSAQANLVKAQKDADRYSFLLKQDAVARQTYDQAVAQLATNKSQVEVAKAGIVSAQTDLSYSLIKAPFTGRIGISQVKLGAEVTPGTTLLNTISSENPIAVDIVVDQDDVERFYGFQRHAADSTFRFVLSDGTTYNAPGKVFAIDRGVNNQTGTVKVRIEFPNNHDILRDGMTGVLNVLNDKSGRHMEIPYKAITEQMGEFFVFVARDTIAEQRKVVLGPHIQDRIVIVDGLQPGEKVITDGFQRLKDKGRITLGMPQQQQQGQGGPGAASGAKGGPQASAQSGSQQGKGK